MGNAIIVQNLSKQFRRYHSDRPWTLQEAFLQGLRWMRPAECSSRLPRMPSKKALST